MSEARWYRTRESDASPYACTSCDFETFDYNAMARHFNKRHRGPYDTEAPLKMANERQEGGSHYTSKKVQPWDAMQAWMSKEEFAGFLRGNAIKYLARCWDKGGLEDLKKARHYLDKLIETESQ